VRKEPDGEEANGTRLEEGGWPLAAESDLVSITRDYHCGVSTSLGEMPERNNNTRRRDRKTSKTEKG